MERGEACFQLLDTALQVVIEALGGLPLTFQVAGRGRDKALHCGRSK
jgi:hypothetical protein